jgi:hypothetical protein
MPYCYVNCALYWRVGVGVKLLALLLGAFGVALIALPLLVVAVVATHPACPRRTGR